MMVSHGRYPLVRKQQAVHGSRQSSPCATHVRGHDRRGLQNRSPTAMCIHIVHTSSPKAVCKQNWNSPAVSLCYVYTPAKGLQRPLLPLMTPEQSKSGDFPIERPRLKTKLEMHVSASPRRLMSTFGRSPEQCCLLWTMPCLSCPAWAPLWQQEVNLCLEQLLPLSAAVGVTAKALGHSWSWRVGLGTASAVRLQAIILSSGCHFNWVLCKSNRVAVKLKCEKVMPSGNARCSQGTGF